VGMGGIRELLDGKIWEWDLSFRWEWDWNGNEVIEMGGNWYEKSVPAHLYPAVAAVDRYLLPVGAQQQTCHTLLQLSIDGTDRQTPCCYTLHRPCCSELVLQPIVHTTSYAMHSDVA